MPNYASNILTVEPDWQANEKKRDLEFIKFKKDNIKLDEDNSSSRTTGEAIFSFSSIVPMPKELEIEHSSREESETLQAINKKKYGYSSWYDFNCEKWGTKWDAVDPYICQNDDSSLMIQFDTAWSPPLQWLEAASKKYPLLFFTMEITEESQAYIGLSMARNGHLEPNICDVRWPE